MNMMEEVEVLQHGFLIKSPPLETKKGLGKFFKALSCSSAYASSDSSRPSKKWRKRYCYLYKPKNALPTEYCLEYFTDKRTAKRKGSVDLDNCRHIVSNAQVDERKHVFSLKTMHKGRERVYYFGAESVEDMEVWVKNLCFACGLTAEDENVHTNDLMPASPTGIGPESLALSPNRPSFSGSLARAGMRKGSGGGGTFFPLSSTPSNRSIGVRPAFGTLPTAATPGVVLLDPTGSYYNLSGSEPGLESGKGPNLASGSLGHLNGGRREGEEPVYQYPREPDYTPLPGSGRSSPQQHSYVNLTLDEPSSPSAQAPPLPKRPEKKVVGKVEVEVTTHSNNQDYYALPNNPDDSRGTVVIDGHEYVLASDPSNPVSGNRSLDKPLAKVDLPPFLNSNNDEYYNMWEGEGASQLSQARPVNNHVNKASPLPTNHPIDVSNAHIFRRSLASDDAVFAESHNGDTGGAQAESCPEEHRVELMQLPRRARVSTASSSSSSDSCSSDEEEAEKKEVVLPPPQATPPPVPARPRQPSGRDNSSPPHNMAPPPPPVRNLGPVVLRSPSQASPKPARSPARTSAELHYLEAEDLDLGPPRAKLVNGTASPAPTARVRPQSFTEYKEIDPVSTNALAQVTRQYLGQETE